MGATGQAGYKEDPTKVYEVAASSQYPARCIQVIELGSQPNTHPQATHPFKLEVMLIWEISELMEDGKPFTVNKRYTNSLGDKANLRKDLETWRNAKFTEEQLKLFEYKNLLDKSCLLGVTADPSKKPGSNRVYNNVKSVTPLPEPMKPMLIERVNDLVDFGLGDIEDTPLFKKVWPWVRKIVLGSVEIKESGYVLPEELQPTQGGGAPQAAEGQPSGTVGSGEPAGSGIDDSDIPF